MPKLLMSTPSVNGLNKAKKRTAAANKRKYKGIGAVAPAAANIVGDTSGLTDAIVSKLTDVRASVNEISSQLFLTGGQNAPWASKAIDRYISASSNLRKQVTDLNSFLESKSGELLNLNDADVSRINSVYQELTTAFGEVADVLSKETPKRQQALKKVFAVFVPDLAKLSEELIGKVLSQSSSGITATPISITTLPKEAQPNPEQIPEPPKGKPAWKGDPAFFQTGAKAGTPKKPRKKAPPAAGGDPDFTGMAEMMGSGFTHPIFGNFSARPVSGMVGNKKDACGRSSGTRFYGTPCDSNLPMMGGGVKMDLRPYMPSRFL